MSPAPRTLFRASSGNSPEPGRHRCPVTAARVARAAASLREGGPSPLTGGIKNVAREARAIHSAASRITVVILTPSKPRRSASYPSQLLPDRRLILQPKSQDRGKQTIDHFTFISRNRGQGEGSHTRHLRRSMGYGYKVGAFFYGCHHRRSSPRVSFGQITFNQQDRLARFNVIQTDGRSAFATYFFQTGQQRAADGTVRKIEVVGLETSPGKLAGQVVLLVGCPGRAKNANWLARIEYFLDATGNVIECLGPRDRLQLAIAVNQRLPQPVPPQGSFMGAPPPGAEPPQGYRVGFGRCHAHQSCLLR